MGMENIVKLIQYRITPMESEKGEINITRVFHRDDYKSLDAVITALRSGEKYKLYMEECERKHFPKLKKEYAFCQEERHITIDFADGRSITVKLVVAKQSDGRIIISAIKECD